MSELTGNQPAGTPTWIELDVPDLDRAMAFYTALFGWEYAEEPTGDRTCLLRGRPVAGLRHRKDADSTTPLWMTYFATDDCAAAAERVTELGGTLLHGPADRQDHARTVIAVDPVGARFGLWQGRARLGCEVVNEPNSLVRNDLATPTPKPARAFYTKLFDFTLDGNEDLPGFDFTFLRRPDGKEIGGIFGSPEASSSAWATTFEVADTDAVLARAVVAGGTANEPDENPYGRFGTLVDPFGAEFSVITRAD
jgi:uncharacterized protein